MISVRMLPTRAGQAMGGDLAPAATATIPATPPVGMAAGCLTDPFTTTTPRLAQTSYYANVYTTVGGTSTHTLAIEPEFLP